MTTLPSPVRPILLMTLWAVSQHTLAGADAIHFDQEIAPILVAHCLECHQGSDPEGGLQLTELKHLLKGGDSGPAVVPGEVDQSLLWERVVSGEMPPENPIGESEKEKLRQWLKDGAKWGVGPLDLFSMTTDRRAGKDWWSLQPLRSSDPPAVDSAWIRNAIDQFVYHKLTEQDLEPSPAADRRVLIRRLSYDLTGLPPRPEEIDAFLNDESNDAYEKLVNRLLDSPHYGERWGRHWLDVVHFGESNGFERNQPRNNAWPYRNWVIEALNNDMPYDEFVRQQIAGDILAADSDGTIAVACLVTGPHNTVKPKNDTIMRKTMRQDEMEDMVGMVNQVFLGMTTNCARCHDHKFDPITSRDYYSMASALAGVEFGERNVPMSKQSVHQAEALKTQLTELGGELHELENTARQAALKDIQSPDETESGPQPISARASGIHIVTEAELVKQLSPQQQQRRGELNQEIQKAQDSLTKLENVRVWTVQSIKPASVKVLNRGDVRLEGDVVSPRGLSAVQTISSDFGLSHDAPDGERREKLALWITDPENPLFSRVIVNRLWHYHFGAGLVSTPNDFGFNGGQPSHPFLLDWLATELKSHQWSLKHLHRQIVNSATYRQSSTMNSSASAVDAENRLLWRKEPSRLEGEALRDTLLSIAGKLDRIIGGTGYRDMREYKFKGSHFYDPIEQDQPEQFRRTIYRFSPRGAKRTMLDTFDCPDPSALTPKRSETTTPLQSLALMNNQFVLRMAKYTEDHLQTLTPKIEEQVQILIRLGYGREADARDLERALPFIENHGLAAYCRVVFNSNELLYVR
ncbi:MAG: PSD1 and planctomycete cytochrome C domain-containing protein [Rubripirellula sp.]